jgi:HSP20 family protein
MKYNLDFPRRRMLSPVWDIMREFDEAFNRMLPEIASPETSESGWFEPEFDLQENDNAYFLNVDLPGVKKEDLRVDVSGHMLTISGERRYEKDAKTGRTHRYERAYGKFTRSFTLPENVKADAIEANLEDGVLSVALPKAEVSKGRSIEIQTQKGGGFFSKLLGEGKERPV